MPDVQRGRRPRVLLGFLLVVAALLLLVLAFSDSILNAWVIPRLVGPGLRKQNVTLEPGRVHWSLSANLLHADSLRIRLPLRAAQGTLEASASDVALRGADWLALLFGRGFSARSLEIGSLRCVISRGDSLAAPAESSAVKKEGGPSHPISVGRLTVSSGSLGMHLPLGGLQIDTVAELSLTARDLSFGAGPVATEAVMVLLKAANVKLSGVRLELPSPGYTLKMARLDMDAARGLRIEDLSARPTLNDSAFFKRSRYKSTRFAVSCRDFTAPAWQWRESSSTLSIPALRFDSLRLEMLANMRKPVDPDTTPLLMPNQMIAGLPFGLVIDTVTVRRGLMKYAEQYPYDRLPAALVWTDFTVHATGIANRPAEAPPATVVGRGIFMGGGPMTLRMILPCTDTLFSMTYTGSLSGMLLPLLNRFVTISDRVRLTSGWCDTVSYGVDIRHGRAEGLITPIY
ncbi:MAG TPA: hypothetical protein VF889_04155, partial [Bacteroidota bacterium]